ncbi:MAG: MBL fold metallo-hydrolase [Bacteroidota bacterium]
MNLFLSLIISLSIGVPRSGSPQIHLLPVGASNVYLIQGSKNVLIDTGTPNGVDKIEKGLEKLGLGAAELDLIVLTHGHGDHGGGTAYLKEKYGIPVLAGKGDAEMMARGTNDALKVQSFMGRLLRMRWIMAFRLMRLIIGSPSANAGA